MSSEDGAGLLQYHDAHSWRFYPYGTDEDGDPLFAFYMNIDENTGVCIYDRNGGAGKFHETAHGEEDYDGRPPSEAFKQVVRDAVQDKRGVVVEDVHALPAHERYFFRVLHGTIEERGRLSDDILAFIEYCVGNEVHLE